MQGTDNSVYPRGLLFHTFNHDATGAQSQFSANVIKEELLSTDGSQISDSESSCSSKPSPAGMRGKNKRMRAQPGSGWVPHCSSTNSSSTGTSPASPTWPADPSPDSWSPEMTLQSRMELLQQKQDIETEISRLQGLLSQIDLKLQQHDQRLLFQRQSQQFQHQQQQQQPMHHFTIHNDTRSQPNANNKPFVLHQSFHYTPPSMQPAHPPVQAPLYPLPQSPAAPQHAAFGTQFQQQPVPAVVVGTPLMQSMAASASGSSAAVSDDIYSKLRMPIDPISISLPSRPFDGSYLSPLVPPAAATVNFSNSFNLSDTADSQASSNAYSTAYAFTNVSMPGLPAPESPLLSAHSASPSSLDEAAKSESEATGPDCENDTDSEMRSSMKGASPISPAHDPIAIDQQPQSLGSSLPFRYMLSNGQTVDPAHLDSVTVHEKKKTIDGFPIKEVRPDRNSDSYRLHLRNGFVAQHALGFAQHQHGRLRPFVHEALPNLTVRSVSTMTSSQQRDDLLLSLPSHLFNSMRHGHMVIMDTLVAVECKVYADGRRESVPAALLRLPNASFAIRCKRSGRDPDRWTLTDFPSSGGGPPRSSDDDSSGDDSSRSRGPRSNGPKGGSGGAGGRAPPNGMNRFVNMRPMDPVTSAALLDPVAPTTVELPADSAASEPVAAAVPASSTPAATPSPLRRRRSSRRGRVSVPPVNVTLASSDSDDGDVSGNLALSSRQPAPANTSRAAATPPKAPSTPIAQAASSQCVKSLDEEKDAASASTPSKEAKDPSKRASPQWRRLGVESMQVAALLLCVAAAGSVNPISWDLTLWGVIGVSVLFITAFVTRQWADCKRLTLKAVRAVAVALGQQDTPILSGRVTAAPPAPAPAQTDLFTHGVSVASAEANLAVRFPALTCAIDIATRSSVYLALSFMLFRENLSFASLAFAVGWSLFARVSGEPAMWREFTHEQGAFWRSSFKLSDPSSWFAVVHAALFVVFLNGPAPWRRFSAVIAPAFMRGKVLRLLPLVFAGATASEWFFSAPSESLPESFNSESSLNWMAGAVLSASTLHDVDIYSASPSELAQARWHAFLLVARCVALVLAPVIFIYWFPLSADREGARARANSHPAASAISPSASEAELPATSQSPFLTAGLQPLAVAE